jgi:formylglycine-generating enzyme required for sulfatase activity
MRWLLVLVALCFSLPAQAVTIDWVPVGNANNLPDTATNCWAANCGSVDHAYSISKYEVTNAQYAEFLNAKAASDPLGLYNESMGSDATSGGITRSGVSGSYTYTVKSRSFTNKPVVYVSFYDALRFSNWLNNGQEFADTETGAYTLLGGTAIPSNGTTVARNGGDGIYLPSENEWYKAAYYSPGGVYFDYPTGTDSETGWGPPENDTGNSANYDYAVNALTNVGAYGLSGSPYGTFDQGGNAYEWNEEIVNFVSGSYRGIRGGSWNDLVVGLAASFPNAEAPANEGYSVGFRVASLVPEPGPGLLGMTAVLGLAASRRRRAN